VFRRVSREATAADLRRQIEELRSQLSRYAEALEEDLHSGREKVAGRTREGIKFEKAFSDSFALLVNHLKSKPECRDLMNELMSSGGSHDNGHGGPPSRAADASG
jgi:serine/threonine-protein kinase